MVATPDRLPSHGDIASASISSDNAWREIRSFIDVDPKATVIEGYLAVLRAREPERMAAR